MAKKVSFDKPTRTKQSNLDADTWVASGNTETSGDTISKSRKAKKEAATPSAEEETTRFTIDIPISLHTRIKTQCATRRVPMKEEIQALLEKHFA